MVTLRYEVSIGGESVAALPEVLLLREGGISILAPAEEGEGETEEGEDKVEPIAPLRREGCGAAHGVSLLLGALLRLLAILVGTLELCLDLIQGHRSETVAKADSIVEHRAVLAELFPEAGYVHVHRAVED